MKQDRKWANMWRMKSTPKEERPGYEDPGYPKEVKLNEKGEEIPTGKFKLNIRAVASVDKRIIDMLEYYEERQGFQDTHKRAPNPYECRELQKRVVAREGEMTILFDPQLKELMEKEGIKGNFQMR